MNLNEATFKHFSLGDVSWEIAVDRDTQEGLALEVEQCTCPPGYVGLSCEDCAPGYERSGHGPYLGTCVPVRQTPPPQRSCPAGAIQPVAGYDGRCQCKPNLTGTYLFIPLTIKIRIFKVPTAINVRPLLSIIPLNPPKAASNASAAESPINVVPPVIVERRSISTTVVVTKINLRLAPPMLERVSPLRLVPKFTAMPSTSALSKKLEVKLCTGSFPRNSLAIKSLHMAAN